MSLSIMRRVKFCAGHRLVGHEGKCAHLHGHNYVAEFYVTGDGVDSVGRVIDFSVLKTTLKGWIDEHWDHGFVVYEKDDNAIDLLEQAIPRRFYTLPYNPTSENLARYLLDEVCPKLLQPLGVICDRVVIWESDESCAAACREVGAKRGK
ncbi:6-carboxy-5,6,7,8-tetrahydropterin synthase [Planctomycetes bacterium Pan216]|uniref:6-carboxy-5,6,7,8-tetrahydropterin synthase n=1 Tax=Kolteria novifilia TaxID=2527975 RepID=A0A518BBT1_9BACT|nr:6-carboxy-5,6,7,8-tetrahydropterin synthase [Planctomycetes bacterium Pan216]